MKKSTFLLIVSVLALFLNSIDFSIELRFQDSSLNYLFVIILWLILVLSIWIKFLSGKKKRLSFLVTLIVSFICFSTVFFVSLYYVDIIKRGFDPSFELIREVKKGNKYYRLYRTNGGATTSYGLILREEKDLPFRLKTIKVIFSKYKAYDATIDLISPNKIKIQIQPYYNNQKVEEKIFKL